MKKDINSNKLFINLITLATSLREHGFINEAQELENNTMAYKIAQSDLYNDEQTGEDLINEAHPDGDVKICEPANDKLNEVGNLISKHKKMVDVAQKESKAQAGKVLLTAVAEVLGLKKKADDTRQGVTVVENDPSIFTSEQKEKVNKYMRDGISKDDAVKAVINGDDITPTYEQALTNFAQAKKMFFDLSEYFTAEANSGDTVAANRAKIAEYMVNRVTSYILTIQNAVSKKLPIDQLIKDLADRITFKTEDELTAWSNKFLQDSIKEYNRVLKRASVDFNFVKRADDAVPNFDAPVPTPNAPAKPVAAPVQVPKKAPVQAPKAVVVNSEERAAVAKMQDLMHEFAVQLQKGTDIESKKLYSEIAHTGAGDIGTSLSSDGKWGSNTARAIQAINTIVKSKGLPELTVGPYFNTGTDPKVIVQQADGNVGKLIDLMQATQITIPASFNKEVEAKLGATLDMLPQELTAQNALATDGSIMLFPKSLDSLNNLFDFINGNGIKIPGGSEENVSEFTVGQWDDIFNWLSYRARSQYAKAEQAKNAALIQLKTAYLDAIKSLYGKYNKLKDVLAEHYGEIDRNTPVSMYNLRAPKKNENAYQHADYVQMKDDEGFTTERVNKPEFNLSRTIDLKELARYADMPGVFDNVKYRTVNLDNLRGADLMAIANRYLGPEGTMSNVVNFLSTLDSALKNAYNRWYSSKESIPGTTLDEVNGLVNEWTDVITSVVERAQRRK